LNPDLFQSRAIIHQYFENYEKAICDLERAAELDYHLQCQSTVLSIRQFMQELIGFLNSKVILLYCYLFRGDGGLILINAYVVKYVFAVHSGAADKIFLDNVGE
jgi:hypothetical protein